MGLVDGGIGRRQRPHDHLVQVYVDPADLAVAVAEHLAAGFETGDPAVVVATPAHWLLFAAELAARGLDVPALEARGELVVLDAEQTLGLIVYAGSPSPRRFAETIGGLLDRVDPARERRVRVYGEMVDLLCRRDDADSAATLEELWNRLGAERPLSLLCGYLADVFDRAAQVSLLPMVCSAHSHVAAASDPERLDRAIDAALAETLGPTDADKVYALVGEEVRRGAVPVGQLALMWVSAHMPRTAERVLASARARYATA